MARAICIEKRKPRLETYHGIDSAAIQNALAKIGAK
jgi:hypothetical protein